MQPTLQMRTVAPMHHQPMDIHAASDRLMAMKQQEEKSANIVQNYFSMKSTTKTAMCEEEDSPTLNTVDEESRMRIGEWCFQVVDYFKLSRETVGIAMSYVDRFLSTPSGSSYLSTKASFQLVSITALHMAVKIHESVELDLELLVKLGRNCYAVDEISHTEWAILSALDWKMHGPTPLAFVQDMLVYLPRSVNPVTRHAILELARYQTELAVLNYSQLSTKASSVAAAAILNAMEALNYDCLSLSSRTIFLKGLLGNFGRHLQMDRVVQCRQNLVSNLGEINDVPSSRQAQRLKKSRRSLLQRTEGSRNLSPVCVAASAS